MAHGDEGGNHHHNEIMDCTVPTTLLEGLQYSAFPQIPPLTDALSVLGSLSCTVKIPRPLGDMLLFNHFSDINNVDDDIIQRLASNPHPPIDFPDIPNYITDLLNNDTIPASQSVQLNPLSIQVLAKYSPMNFRRQECAAAETHSHHTFTGIDIAKKEISDFFNHRKRKCHHIPVEEIPNKRLDQYHVAQIPQDNDNQDTHDVAPIIDRNAKLVNQLQDLVDALLDAEDDFNKSNIWWFYNPTSSYVLAEPVVTQLETLIVRAKDAGVLNHIHLDDMLRIQRMTDKSWKFINTISPESIYNIQQLAILQGGIISGKIVLRLMMHENKQLSSEESISCIIDGINLLYHQFIHKSLLDNGLPQKQQQQQLPAHESLKFIIRLLQHLNQLVSLVSSIVDHHDALSDRIVTSLEYMSLEIAFMDKPSIYLLGANGNVLESLRLASMDVISTLFTNYPDQRSFLLDEILSSWQKLPAGKQSARQFKIGGGSTIQMITVLMMRLVQTCGLAISSQQQQDEDDKIHSFINAAGQAYKVSNEITWFLITKATRSSKLGDVPFRSLMELFAQDLLRVLIKPEWPAAQILLQSLIAGLISGCCENWDKTPAQVTNAALETLGNIESDMGKIRMASEEQHIKPLPSIGAGNQDEVIANEKVIYNPILDYLHNLSIHDCVSRGSEGTLASIWLDNLFKNASEESKPTICNLANEILNNHNTKTGNDELEIIGKNYQRIVVSSPLFVSLYKLLLDSVLRSLGHPKPTVRGRALRVFGIFLSNNAKILTDSNVKQSVIASLLDQSPTGRDAAVDMISKYLIANPSLGLEFYKVICDRSNDTSIAVRKRVVKLLCDMAKNLSMQHNDVKVYIMDRLVKRLDDEESSVSELATKLVGDLLFFDSKDLHDTMLILVKMIEMHERNSNYLRILLTSLGSKGKEQARKILDILFDDMVNNNDTVSPELYLKLAQVLCEVEPSGLTDSQLVVIENYLADGGPNDAVVLPCLIILKNIVISMEKSSKLVKELKQTLFKKLSRYNVRQLTVAIPCLWELCVITNDTKRLAVTLKSCLCSLKPFLLNSNFTKESSAKLIRLLHIIGHLGRYCDLQEYSSMFTDDKKDNINVAEFLTTILAQIARNGGTISRIGLRNLGMVCISHPRLFLQSDNLKVFDEAMSGKDESKENVLRILLEFLQSEEMRAVKNAKQQAAKSKKSSSSRDIVVVDIGVLRGETVKFAEDGVCASLVQRYMEKILSICLEPVSQSSTLIGVMLLNQCICGGFANPRLCMPTIMSLETCNDVGIKNMALDLHGKLFDKYESLIESCYQDGIRLGFKYHYNLNDKKMNLVLNAAKNGIGVLYQFLKSSKTSRRKFLSGLVRVLDTIYDKARRGGENEYLPLAQYVCECIAYVPYLILQEVYQVVYGLDRVVAREGQDILEQPDDDNDDESVSIRAQITVMIWYLRQYLKEKYNLVEEKLREFVNQQNKSINDKKASNIEITNNMNQYNDEFTYPDYCHYTLNDSKKLVNELAQVLGNDRFGEFKFDQDEVI